MTTKESSIPANNIEDLRRAKKWSMEKLAQMVGTNASTINKIEKGHIRATPERLLKIAEALGVTLNDIYMVDGELPSIAPTATAPATISRIDQSQIPVMGTAAGSLISGTFQITSGPVDWIDRPKALENAKGVYALYITGTSMEPMFRQGSIAIVSEYKPPRVGDVVIVQEKNGENADEKASIGFLESRSSEVIKLGKLNPVSTIEIKAGNITHIHKVLDYGELLGIS